MPGDNAEEGQCDNSFKSFRIVFGLSVEDFDLTLDRDTSVISIGMAGGFDSGSNFRSTYYDKAGIR